MQVKVPCRPMEQQPLVISRLFSVLRTSCIFLCFPWSTCPGTGAFRGRCLPWKLGNRSRARKDCFMLMMKEWPVMWGELVLAASRGCPWDAFAPTLYLAVPWDPTLLAYDSSQQERAIFGGVRPLCMCHPNRSPHLLRCSRFSWPEIGDNDPK